MIHTGKEITIDIGDIKIGAKVWGKEEGIPVLAIHGWIDNAASFDFISPLLPELKIVAIDCPGCGHSFHHPEGIFYNVINESFLMFRIAEALGWDKFSVIGHSRGGVIAYYMAIAAPERIEKVVIIDIITNDFRTEEDNLSQMRNALKAYLKPTEKEGGVYPTIEDAAKMRVRNGLLRYESALALAKRGTILTQQGITWYFDRQHLKFHSPQLPTEAQTRAYLAAIEAPFCIVLGEQGLFMPLSSHLKEKLKQIPHHELHTVPGGHHFHMDDPEPLAKIVKEFFK